MYEFKEDIQEAISRVLQMLDDLRDNPDKISSSANTLQKAASLAAYLRVQAAGLVLDGNKEAGKYVSEVAMAAKEIVDMCKYRVKIDYNL